MRLLSSNASAKLPQQGFWVNLGSLIKCSSQDKHPTEMSGPCLGPAILQVGDRCDSKVLEGWVFGTRRN